MSLPLAPFGPRTGLRGMVAAADQLAASAGLACWSGAARPPTPPSPPAPPWRSWARTCAGWGATCWPWCHRRPVRPRRSSPSAGPAPAPTPTACAATAIDDAGARRHPQRAGARCRRRLARAARALRQAAAGRGAGAGHRAGHRGVPGLHHAGAGQPSRPRPPRRRRALPGRPARHRADGATAGDRPHAARHRRRRARRLLPGRVRTRPARPRERPLRTGRLRHQRGVVVHAAARHGLGPRAVDRAPPVAGLPDAGRCRGGRGGRARDRSGRSAVGPSPRRDVARRRPRPPGRALRRGGRRRAPPPRAPGGRRRPGQRARHGAARRRAGPRHHRPRRGPPGRRRHHAPVRAGCRRPRHFADAVQRAGLRLAPRRAHDRRLPAQPRRGLLAGPGPPGRGGPGPASAAHPLPHARHQAHRRRR